MDERNTELISVIVPVYNVEAYLPSCVDSILNQTYQKLEILLVDDGSTDRCPQICDDYREKDGRIKVIHKENGGLSDARNAGMLASAAGLIAFIDSDDFVESTYIECLYRAMVGNNADIAMCDYRKVEESTVFRPAHEPAPTGGTVACYGPVECLAALYQPKVHGMEFLAWGKLFRKSLFTDNHILFPKGVLYDDTSTTYKLVYNAKKIVFVDLANYSYRIRPGSIMTSKFSLKRFDVILAKREECRFFADKERELYNYAVNSFFAVAVRLYRNLARSAPFKDKKQVMRRFLADYREDCGEFLLKSDLPLAKKAAYCLFGYSALARLALECVSSL